MTIRLTAAHTALALAGVLSFAATSALAAAPARDNCFLSANWEGWKSPDPNVIYLKVGVGDVFRLDLAAPSSQLQEPDVHLVSQVRGSDWICSPVDLDLQLSDNNGGFREPLFVKSMTRLTPDEISAIPPKFRP